jgi:hypothetical protein
MPNFFKEWVIVTSPDDQATIDLINEACLSNITVLYFDKFTHNAAFNKGGALVFGQEYVINKYKDTQPTNCILILDSDIFISNNFKDVLSGFTPEDDTIYGVSKRVDYHSLEDFLNNKNGSVYDKAKKSIIVKKSIIGYFQLYKLNSKYKYSNSFSCAECDLFFFCDLFPFKRRLDLSVSHLGAKDINWNGRDKRLDNIYTNTNKCKTPFCKYLINTNISRNIGPYCCYRCKNKRRGHGTLCEKIFDSQSQS